ncbi:uncharacterized protein LOC136039303 [Artemia franciscana]|uniref:uncharacterized protein LOC136039303 n=1 Tax=Artemia franciscana TaxID=6661 RepID=UPI0032D9DD72
MMYISIILSLSALMVASPIPSNVNSGRLRKIGRFDSRTSHSLTGHFGRSRPWEQRLEENEKPNRHSAEGTPQEDGTSFQNSLEPLMVQTKTNAEEPTFPEELPAAELLSREPQEPEKLPSDSEISEDSAALSAAPPISQGVPDPDLVGWTLAIVPIYQVGLSNTGRNKEIASPAAKEITVEEEEEEDDAIKFEDEN